MTDLTHHWENVYSSKAPDKRSWTQPVPSTSLKLINGLNLEKTSPVIDVGGGESTLADHLLDEGFTDVTILDISANALATTAARVSGTGKQVITIASNVLAFTPVKKYKLWHDRATFHFLTTDEDVFRYYDVLTRSGAEYIIMATFAKGGPAKCSGLDIRQYDPADFQRIFSDYKIRLSFQEVHRTPFDTDQLFTWVLMEKL